MFKCNSITGEVLVRDCLLPKTRYELWFYVIVNGTIQTCGSQKQQQLPGILDIKTITAVCRLLLYICTWPFCESDQLSEFYNKDSFLVPV